MAFRKIILWCEFPKTVNWKKAESLLKDIPAEIYIAVKSKKEFMHWKRKTRLKTFPWPILPKSQGYWFSGFTPKKGIDQLNQYKGMKIKIDLEPPLPSWKYTTPKIISYGIKKIFQRGKNSGYLEQTIHKLSGLSDLELVTGKEVMIVNEFPFLKWYLKNQGIYISTKHNKHLTKNIMCYTSFAGKLWRPVLRSYLKFFTKRAVKKDPDIMFSIGLIGTGILQTEGTYSGPYELRQDLKMIHDSGAKKVAIYSLDSILKRPNPEEWVDEIRHYI